MTSVQRSGFISSKTVRYILIISILAIAFSVSFMMRSQGAQVGFELAEFDPFFNYRATNFILENGIPAYFEWWDDKSWFLNIEPKTLGLTDLPPATTCAPTPTLDPPPSDIACYTPENVLNNEEINRGRNVSETSQTTLHITAAMLYKIFGAGTSLYDFTILFPVIIGSLTVVAIFAVVRTIGGTTAGLVAALLFSVSVPIILRGFIGWFKSEPLGIFLGLIAIYLCLSGIKSGYNKLSLIRIAGAGVVIALSMNAWGGSLFFLIILGLFFLVLPFFRNDKKFIAYAAAIFIFSTVAIFSQLDPASFGSHIINGYLEPGMLGLLLFGVLLFVSSCAVIQKIKQSFKTSYGLIILGSFSGIGFLVASIIGNVPSLRYQTAANPFLVATDPLTESISEHAFSSLSLSFFFHSILMIFAVIGIWLIFQNKINKSVNIKNEMAVFALITGITGLYFSSSFVRLELFASISMIILASIGISILISKIFTAQNTAKSVTKISFVACIAIFLVIPIGLPLNDNWVTSTSIAPAILYGGSYLMEPTNDWPDAMLWVKTNTPENAKILSWWDYGYWIETLGDRITYADNATLDTQIIKKTAQMYYSSPEDGWEELVAIDADYVLIWITAERVMSSSDIPMFLLGVGGGDESKRYWFAEVAQIPLEKYFFADLISGPNAFWNDTLLGKMIPFSPVMYVNPVAEKTYDHYEENSVAVYVKDQKFSSNEDSPLELVYASPSFDRTDDGEISAVLIYKVNKDYKTSFEYNILDD
jgi:dolichyl-diphosphooligosaccharide--protein glycosyltransferase